MAEPGDSIDDYVASVLEHKEHMKRCDGSNAYRTFLRMLSTLKSIYAADDGGRAVLHRLIEHEDDMVRCWAASHLMPLDEAAAVACLETLASESVEPAGMDAQLVLNEWRAGRLSGTMPA